MRKYDFKKIEKKWQEVWQKEKVYEPNLKFVGGRSKKPFYNLMMFPYPSAEGLHVGNMYAFTGADIYGRFKRMQGYDVFEPIGLDGFGIHSENYALKIGMHPAKQAKISEKRFYKQLASIGNGFAWDERLETYDPEYYKWTQWIFAEMFKKGLAYRKKQAVNWCPSCKTVLADEQVIQKQIVSRPGPEPRRRTSSLRGRQVRYGSGKSQIGKERRSGVCERCRTMVVKKDWEQWFFRITKYADRLLDDLKNLDWSERVKIAQENWIGKSEGAIIEFAIRWGSASSPRKSAVVKVFTTRPDTLFGATYLVFSPEHPLIQNNELRIKNYKEVRKYIETAKRKSEEERITESKGKTGVELKGVKTVNPANGEEIPIWVADYVLADVGTGAIMAVPGHDQRDYDFAVKYKLPIRMVVCPHYPAKTCPVLDEAYLGEGHMVDSGKFDGMDSEKAKWEITKFVGGEGKVQYHLRDWLISRQRYWGAPIPLVFCEACKKRVENSKSEARNLKHKKAFSIGEFENPGWVAVPEKDLPIRLPFVKNFKPLGTGKSPLATDPKFYKTKCPRCGGPATRETDVSDTFLDSAWYYLAYLGKEDSKFEIRNSKFKRIARRWLPINLYTGGAEHSVLHLLYVRFLAKVFYDWGWVKFNEPAKKFRAHGLLISEGAKMSKSKGNIVNPDFYINKFGADTLRMYLMFLAPFEQGGDFRDAGILGIERFLARVWKLYSDTNIRPVRRAQGRPEFIEGRMSTSAGGGSAFGGNDTNNMNFERLLHKTIKKVGEDIETLNYNTAVSAMMILLNKAERKPPAKLKASCFWEVFLKLLAPFAPHMTEEIWQLLRGQTQTNTRTIVEFFAKSASGHHRSTFRSIHISEWPKYDLRLIQDEKFTLVVQVNGRVRDSFEVAAGISQAEAEKLVLGREKVKTYLKDAKLKKVVFVPGRLINLVTSK